MKKISEKPVTFYASAEKASFSEIDQSYHSLKNDPLLRMFQEAMPDLSMIVNKQRQLVYANSNLIKFLDLEDNHIPLGERLGNLLNCIHSDDHPSGCGTTLACRFCGVVNAVMESQQTTKPIVKEARITAMMDKEEVTSYDLKIKASPLIFKDKEYTIICINDISDRKRRAFLETSYINDMYGNAAELKNVVSSIKKDELNPDNRNLIEAVEKVNYELMNDLLAQKMLNEAEEGTLERRPLIANSVRLLKEMEEYFGALEISKGKKLFVDPFSHSVRFRTDINILRRVLINIINNAFEAIQPEKVVQTSVRLNDKVLKYTVFSPVELTEEAKHQIFQRSFTTKGPGRGLGTYTARLLTAKYLKGKIYFHSDKKGTSFIIELPLDLE